MRKKFRRFLILLALVAGVAAFLSWKFQKSTDTDLFSILTGEQEGTESATDRLKAFLNRTSGLTDDELRQEIRKLASEKNIRLTETQVQQLLDLCRMMEKLNPEQLKERAESLQKLLRRAGEAKDKISGLLEMAESLISMGRITAGHTADIADGAGRAMQGSSDPAEADGIMGGRGI